MKMAAAILVSALLGLAICFGCLGLSQWLGTDIDFPAPRGEEDFSTRAAFFFFAVCPAFMLIGVWIGHAGCASIGIWLSMWAGVLAGSIVAFAATLVALRPIEALTEGSSATYAVILFFGLWLLLAVGGAWSVGRLYMRRP